MKQWNLWPSSYYALSSYIIYATDTVYSYVFIPDLNLIVYSLAAGEGKLIHIQ